MNRISEEGDRSNSKLMDSSAVLPSTMLRTGHETDKSASLRESLRTDRRIRDTNLVDGNCGGGGKTAG